MTTEQAEAARRAGLIGTWRLVSCRIALPDGTTVQPYGDAPSGAIVYSEDGWMSCQMAGGSSGERGAAGRLISYTAYYGPYSVSEGESLVVHQVAGSSVAIMEGDQPRRYDVDGRTLRLTAEMPDSSVEVLWSRP